MCQCGSLQLYLRVIFFSHSLQLSCCSYTLYSWQDITVMLLLLFMFFQYINFVLPWLIIAVYKILLVILEISPSFLQDITIALPLDAVSLVCSDIDIDILSKLKDCWETFVLRIEHDLHGRQINAYKIIRNLNCRRRFVPLSTVPLTVVGNSERTGQYSNERTGQYSSTVPVSTAVSVQVSTAVPHRSVQQWAYRSVQQYRTGQYSSERTG